MTPHEAWRAWDWQPLTLAALVATAALYGRGVGLLWKGGRRRGVRSWQVASFVAGLAAIFVALVSPVHAVSQALLSAHMAQHVLLLAVAPPLIVLGSPAVAFAAALPARWRRSARSSGRTPPLPPVRRALSQPFVVWALALLALWLWHAPPLYQLALRSQSVHVLEHATFFGTALLFWWVALQPSGPRRLPRGFDVLYVFTGSFQGAALGFLMTFATVPLYPFYGTTVGAWGLTPLQDQQLAGIFMWLPTGVIYLIAAGGLFLEWMHAIERSSLRLEGEAQVRAHSPFPPSSPSEALSR